MCLASEVTQNFRFGGADTLHQPLVKWDKGAFKIRLSFIQRGLQVESQVARTR